MRTILFVCVLLLSACAAAPPPPAATPTAATAPAAPAPAETNTELRDGIQAPIDKAKSAEDTTLQGAEDQRQAIEDAGG